MFFKCYQSEELHQSHEKTFLENQDRWSSQYKLLLKENEEQKHLIKVEIEMEMEMEKNYNYNNNNDNNNN